MNPRMRILSAAAVFTAAGALVATSFLGSAGAHPTAPKSAVDHLTLYATPTAGGPLDLGAKGPSAGDEFFEHGHVANAQGHRLGTYTLAITLVAKAKPSQEQQEVTVRLSHGSLDIAGGHPSVNHFSVPVVGGTGRYQGDRGVARFSPGPHHTEKAAITVRH